MGKLYVVCVMWLVACGSRSATVNTPETTGVAERASSVEVVPTEHPTLRGKLLARHTEDLPDGDTLRRMEGAEAGLRWLGLNESKVAVRATALRLLQHFPSEGTSTFLLAVLADASVPSSVRAGAVQGLSSMLDIGGVVDDLAALARGDDLRLALEAADVLKKSPSGGIQVEALSADPAVRDEVKALLQK
jgi:hypothetical protein